MSLILGILDSGGVAAGGGASYESIASATGTGSSGVITFSSIPATYKHLQIRWISRSASAFTVADNIIRFNSDSGSNYAQHQVQGNGASVSAEGQASQTSMSIWNSVSGTTVAANIMGVALVDIADYSSTSKNKTLRFISGMEFNTASSLQRISIGSGLWMDTSAVSSLTITSGSGNFTTASTFALYGIKG
jgi:hypothetical protein